MLSFILLAEQNSSFRAKVTSAREGILLTFQKWYKRRDSELDKAKDSSVTKGNWSAERFISPEQFCGIYFVPQYNSFIQFIRTIHHSSTDITVYQKSIRKSKIINVISCNLCRNRR